MDMAHVGFGGVFSVPSEHLPGLIALLATPLFGWLVICAVRALAISGTGWAVATVQRLDQLSMVARLALVGSFVGAVVHAALVPTHWADENTLAKLFILDTIGFAVAFGWTFAGRRGWRAVSLAMLGGTVVGYVFYILKGWETLDLVGLLTTTVELAVALVLLYPAESPVGAARSRERWVMVAAVPVALLALLGAGVVASATQTASADEATTSSGMAGMGSASGKTGIAGLAAGMSGMAGMTKTAGTPLALPTASPAGRIVWPVSMAGMAPGMTMATGACTARPTAKQQQAAVALVNKTVAAAAPYRSLAAAKAAGYVPLTPTGARVVHYINPTVYRQGHLLDPHALPVLVYVNTSHGAVLSAAMYLMPLTAGERPPQPGGCLTQWHIHTNLCFRSTGVVGTTSAGACPVGSINVPTPPMMHVWLAPVPGGPLATDPSDVAEVVAANRLPALSTPNGTA